MLSMLRRQGTPMRAHLQLPESMVAIGLILLLKTIVTIHTNIMNIKITIKIISY